MNTQLILDPAAGNGGKTQRRVIVCAGTGCVANGAYQVIAAFNDQIAAAGISVTTEFKAETSRHDLRLNKSGCQGFCQMGPLVTILPDEILYNKVKLEDVEEIVRETLVGGKVVDRLLYVDPATKKHCQGINDIPFYQRQQRFVLKECGTIDPESIHEYLHHGGYAAASKAILKMSPEQIVQEITKSGLRGRGGGGFPTGRKWEAARAQKSAKKYVICNADEGDPGAFMNRSVMEGNPHSVLEGLMIAARAIGADETLVYVRTEYPLAVARMKRAVEDAQKMGFLGDNVFGSGQSLNCEVMEGAGAFVCGEETAMIASIEGQRGMPRPKPPFPAQSGLWGKPTIINNVETLAHVVRIINEGADTFRKLGSSGLARHQDLCADRPRGQHRPDRSAVRHHAARGGVQHRRRHHRPARQGEAERIQGRADRRAVRRLPDAGTSRSAARLRFAAQRRRDGRLRRSGGDERKDLHGQHRAVLHGFHPARKLRQMRAVPRRHAPDARDAGRHHRRPRHRRDLELLEKLALAVQKGSLCGLGKTAPNPVLSTLRYFREEYDAHVFHKHCPTGQCKALAKPSIDPAKCKGCTACAKKCPVGAISGEKKKAARH